MTNVTLTFDDLNTGDVVNNQYQAEGVSIFSIVGGVTNPSNNPAMVFDTNNPTGGDWDLATSNLNNVLIVSEDGDSSDPDDRGAGGVLCFDFDDTVTMDKLTLLDVEEGARIKLWDANGQIIYSQMHYTSDNGQKIVDFGDVEGVARMDIVFCGSGAVDNISYDTAAVAEPDGTVEGTAGDDLIDITYTGDPDGDMIDNDDAVPGIGTGNEDLVYGYGGDDTIIAGEDDDEVYGGSGDDSIEGNEGDDLLYGDFNPAGSGGGSTVRESLNWSEENAGNDFTQNTGSVDVSFTIVSETGSANTSNEATDQYVSGIDSGSESINDNSSMYSVTNGDWNSAKYELEFSNEVENVEFRINDIDGSGTVKVKAYDADGNQIDIDLTGGNKLTLMDTDSVAGADKAVSQGGYEADDSPNYSLLVEIPGPVAKIVIEHKQVGGNNSGINVTDVFFDVTAVDDGDEGNDTLNGGDGNDVMYGQGGDDRIIGGAGDDIAYGGDGNDNMDDVEGSKKDNADNDLYYGGAGDDEMYTGLGDDTLYGGDGDDIVRGEGGNDTVYGDAGDDEVSGGKGEDEIYGGDGSDLAYGGNDDDYIDTSGETEPLPDVAYPGIYGADSDPNNDLDTVYGGGGNDTILTGDDDDEIYGGAGDDDIDAGIDDDYVEAGSGNDTVVGSEGNDEVYGGTGNDLIYGGLDNSFPDAINIPDDGSGPFGPDLVTDNNNDTLFGGDGNDTIYGQDDADTLYGDAGNDFLDGGVDDDEIHGGDGKDTITGGQGNDEQFGGFGSDLFLGGNGGDNVVGGEDPDDGDTDVLDLTGSDVDFITYTSADKEDGIVTFLDGSTMTFSEIENVIPCFTPGTAIATPKGERLVEDLREGDRIITRDNGIQEIRWVGRKDVSGKQLVKNPHLKPVLIKAGALGNGLPERDMLVSPNHRVLVASDMTQLYFEEREVLAAAKHLVGVDGIHEVDVMSTSYIHFMFDRHEVVLSNGSWTESFQPGDYSLKGIGNAQRNEIFELFPELASKPGLEGYQSARRALKKHEAKLLVK